MTANARCLPALLRGLHGKQSRLFTWSTRSVSHSSDSKKSILAVGEVDRNGSLTAGTLSVLSAARCLLALGCNTMTVLLTSQQVPVGTAESAAKQLGVSQVVAVDHPCLEHQQAEPIAQIVATMQKQHTFSHVVACTSTLGKSMLPRAAAKLGVQPITDVVAILDPDTYLRPIYAGNAFARVRFKPRQGLVRLLTVRPTAFDPAIQARDAPPAPIAYSPAQLVEAAAQGAACGAQWMSASTSSSQGARPDLSTARAVVCGGRALKSADNFRMLEQLAEALGGAVGASRAAVDAGYAPNDLQVGQTGKVVAPELYVGVGISGAIQHLAGMKDSRTIVAINTDPDAPIFQLADYGLVEDLFTAVPRLTQLVHASRQ